MALRFPAPSAAPRYELLIGRLLDAVPHRGGGAAIVYRDAVRHDYATLRRRVGRLAAVLADAGAGPGTVVGVLDWDSHRYLECFFAVPMMGAVLMTANVRLPEVVLVETIARAGAAILLVHRDFLPLVARHRTALRGVRAVVAIADGSADPLPADAHGEYETLLAAGAATYPFTDFDENAIATTFFTTGTTGKPKQVSFTHRQIVLHVLATNAPFGVTRSRGFGADDVYMPLTPMFHVHAWCLPYVATVLGVTQVYPGRFDAGTALRLRAREGVSFSHGVPTVLHALLDEADRTGTDLAGWHMNIGGATLTRALFERARARGMDIIAGYGLSESGPMLTNARAPAPGAGADAEADRAARSAAGRPVPLVSLRVLDEAGRDVAADGEALGLLHARAPWLAGGYDDDPEAGNALWRDGWLRTGDVATLDRDGTVRVRDRLADTIKSGGEWICSTTLEAILDGLDGVAELAVVARPDGRWGERPVAVVVATPGGAPSLDVANARIAHAARAGVVARHARLDALLLVDALPRTGIGKIDKRALRRTVRARSPAAAPALP